MKTDQFLTLLQAHPDHEIRFLTPDGESIPPHYHITEVGHLAKSFIDCGGKRHTTNSCLMQIWVADDIDHRLKASKLLAIFNRADGLLPTPDLPIEIEAESPILTQLPLIGWEIRENTLWFQTEFKHTDCLAKDLCLPDFSLPAIPGSTSCQPGSGCC